MQERQFCYIVWTRESTSPITDGDARNGQRQLRVVSDWTSQASESVDAV